MLIDGNDIYFATYTSSRKVAHYRANPKACVYFYEKGKALAGEFEKRQTENLKKIEESLGEKEFAELTRLLSKTQIILDEMKEV